MSWPDEGQLRTALRRLWSEHLLSPRRRSVLEHLHFRELVTHLAIFVCVVVAWAAIALDRSHVVAKMVPLEIRGVAEGLTFDPLRYTTVALELRGSRRELEFLPTNAVQAYVDLSRMGSGTRTFRVQADAPAGIEVANCSPASVELRIRPRPGADVAPAVRPSPEPTEVPRRTPAASRR